MRMAKTNGGPGGPSGRGDPERSRWPCVVLTVGPKDYDDFEEDDTRRCKRAINFGWLELISPKPLLFHSFSTG